MDELLAADSSLAGLAQDATLARSNPPGQVISNYLSIYLSI